MKDFPLVMKDYGKDDKATKVLGGYDEMQTKLED